MSNKIEYCILSSASPGLLGEQVLTLMEAGWEPSGGIAVGIQFLYQAMVRRTPAKPKKKKYPKHSMRDGRPM